MHKNFVEAKLILFFKSTVVEVKGRMVGIIGYVTRSTEYNFPLHEVIFNYKWYFTYILEM